LTIRRLCIAFLLMMAARPSASAAPSSSGRLLVANKGDHTLSVIDPETGKTLASVAENGVTGHEVAASLDGTRAYVPIYGSGGVGGSGTNGSLLRVIDIARGEIVGTVDFGKGVRPHCVQVGPKTGRIYVTTELLQAITVIDPVSLKVIGTIPTGRPESHMLALSQDEKRGYVVNVGSGTISILDLEKRELVAVVPVSSDCQRIALSTDGRWVFTADQTQPRIAVVDTEKQKVADWIALPSTGFGTTTTPDGKWLIVTLAHANQLAIIDLATRKVVHTLDLPRSPQESVARPDGGAVYVSCDSARQVAEIDPQTWTVKRLFQAGPVADGLAWASLR
jgi:VCBS repeat-containing protein